MKKIENSQYANEYETYNTNNNWFLGQNEDFILEKNLKENDRECSICLEKINENNLRFGLLRKI